MKSETAGVLVMAFLGTTVAFVEVGHVRGYEKGFREGYAKREAEKKEVKAKPRQIGLCEGVEGHRGRPGRRMPAERLVNGYLAGDGAPGLALAVQGRGKGDLMSQTEDDLAQALKKFGQKYRDSIWQSESDAAKRARELISSAHKLLLDSFVGSAFTELFAVERDRWRDRLKDSEFPFAMAFRNEEDRASETETWRIAITYAGVQYESKVHHDGTVPSDKTVGELTVDGEGVLKASWDGFLSWREAKLHSFKAGDWMKDLLKMEADIKQYYRAKELRAEERDLIARATNIQP